MPNTLGHLGVQALVTRGVIRGAEPAWIWVGCILPDLPWIGQRLLRALPLDLSPYDIRLYAIVQSSLAFSCLAAAGLACFAPRPLRVLAILALGCLLHLLMDATQTKWANGVLLFAPFDWTLLNFELFWPEDWPSLVLTAAGLAGFAWMAFRHPPGAVDPGPRRPVLRVAGVVLLGIWLAGPVAYMETVARNDLHYVQTLRDVASRANRCVAFDRNPVHVTPGGDPVLRAWTGENLPIVGIVPPTETILVSLKGCFEESGALRVEMLHQHPVGTRFGLTLIGLSLIAFWLALALWRQAMQQRQSPL